MKSSRTSEHLAPVRRLLATTCLTAAVIVAAPAAFAQAPAAGAQLDEVVVTGSRVTTAFNAPTPTTVLGADLAQARGATNVATLLNEMPAFRASNTGTTTVTSSASGGANFLNLRSLGAQRTLILVDGRRHVPTTSAGLVDLNAIPVNLVKRVEVVTGGASAAYGSDAVAGVVNLILDDELQGARFEAQYGQTEHNDNREWRVGAAFGTGFAGGRGHVVVGGEFVDNDGILDQDDRKWGRNAHQLIVNPLYTPTNGQPQRIISANVYPTNATEGGLITNGVLANTRFLPGGASAPFVRGDYATSTFMVGGVGGDSFAKYVGLLTPLERGSLFGRVNYDLTEKVRIYGEASFARSVTDNDVVQPYDFGSIVIRSDNAYLDPALRARLLAAGQTSFNMGRINTDFGFYRAHFNTKTSRGVLGAKGEFGSGWTWDAYVQEGKTDYRATLRNRVNSRFANAVDAVVSPLTGQAACRINTDAVTTNDDTACQPLNLFGAGSPSAVAINYVMAQQWQTSEITQRVAEASVSGSPFSTWAGPVNIAAGLDYREDKVDTRVDALSIASAYTIGNPKPIKGSYDVKEVFGEILVPLLRDTALAQSFDLNGAVRRTDYSTSGKVTTWKIGGNWQVNDWLRLRATRSRDIRAPNIDELFTSGQLRFATVISGGQQLNISTLAGGNQDLQAEKSDALTAGFVFQPKLVSGFSLAVDYYRFKVDGAIGTLGGQQVVDRCAAGSTSLCDRLVFSGGVLSQVILTQLNLNTLKTSGVDIESSYSRDLGDVFDGAKGRVTARLLATYIHNLETDDGVTAIDRAGDVGNSIGGVPHWKVNTSLTYAADRLSLFLQGRYVGGGDYDHTFASNGINKYDTKGRFYTNASVTYDVRKGEGLNMQVFASVSNLFDVDPPVVPGTFFATIATNGEIYDVIGRTFSLGFRGRF